MKHPAKRQSAFTLIELLVGVGLFVLLALAMAAFSKDLAQQRSTLARVSEASRVGTVLIDALERDLMMSVAGGGRLGSGVQGDASGIRILTCGVAVGEGSIGADLLEVSYRWDEASGTLRIAQRPIISTTDAPAIEEVLSSRVARLRFRYHTGTQWSDAYDTSQAGRLPAAVEVAIWMMGEGPRVPRPATAPDPADEGFGVAPVEQPDLGEPDRIRIIAVPDSAGESGGLLL